jgi:hypothetical protein
MLDSRRRASVKRLTAQQARYKLRLAIIRYQTETPDGRRWSSRKVRLDGVDAVLAEIKRTIDPNAYAVSE